MNASFCPREKSSAGGLIGHSATGSHVKQHVHLWSRWNGNRYSEALQRSAKLQPEVAWSQSLHLALASFPLFNWRTGQCYSICYCRIAAKLYWFSYFLNYFARWPALLYEAQSPRTTCVNGFLSLPLGLLFESSVCSSPAVTQKFQKE